MHAVCYCEKDQAEFPYKGTSKFIVVVLFRGLLVENGQIEVISTLNAT
jgi:hypothetical protein